MPTPEHVLDSIVRSRHILAIYKREGVGDQPANFRAIIVEPEALRLLKLAEQYPEHAASWGRLAEEWRELLHPSPHII